MQTVNTGWRDVTPGKCMICGSDDEWDCDGRGTVYCSCDTCAECGMLDGHEIGCEEGAVVAAMLGLSDDSTETRTAYLALYTGPNGPISAEFSAWDLRGAHEAIEIHSREWYAEGADALNLPAGATEDEIAAALEAGGWTLVYRGQHTGEYDVYEGCEEVQS